MKTTSGHHDGKHSLQALPSCKIRSLANHFAKSTKYMTEESEHYMDYPQGTYYLRPYWIQNPKVHKSPATSLDPDSGTQDKHTTRPELLGAVTTIYSTKAGHVARLLLASRP
jgi:hypothetical protein